MGQRWLRSGYGYEKDDVVGKNISRLFGFSQSHRLSQINLAMPSMKDFFYRGELRCRRKNGDEYWCEAEFQPMFTDGGEFKSSLS